MIVPKLIICPINKVVELLSTGKADCVLSLLSKKEQNLFYKETRESLAEVLNESGKYLKEVTDYEFRLGNNFEGIEKYIDEGNWKIVTMSDYLGQADTTDMPNQDNVSEAINFATEKIDEGKQLIIHCQMGFSRSPAIAYLVLCNYVSPQDAINELYKIRSTINPNINIVTIGDEMLGLNGEAVSALKDKLSVKKIMKESFEYFY